MLQIDAIAPLHNQVLEILRHLIDGGPQAQLRKVIATILPGQVRIRDAWQIQHLEQAGGGGIVAIVIDDALARLEIVPRIDKTHAQGMRDVREYAGHLEAPGITGADQRHGHGLDAITDHRQQRVPDREPTPAAGADLAERVE